MQGPYVFLAGVPYYSIARPGAPRLSQSIACSLDLVGVNELGYLRRAYR